MGADNDQQNERQSGQSRFFVIQTFDEVRWNGNAKDGYGHNPADAFTPPEAKGKQQKREARQCRSEMSAVTDAEWGILLEQFQPVFERDGVTADRTLIMPMPAVSREINFTMVISEK